MTSISQWTVFETTLSGTNPFWDVNPRVRFAAPSGKEHEVDAFWDGGQTWRVRFSPDEVGEWTWRSHCAEDSGLDGQQGRFTCVPYGGDNPLYRHGALRLSRVPHYLVHHDGTPFFWMADTAWNGVLRARPEDWQRYLALRQEQGFTAVQFVTTQWRGSSQDGHGEVAFTSTEAIRLNPAFFRRMDPKVAACNEHGLMAAPVILWANTPTDPGQTLAEAEAVRLARYIVARWGAYQVVWFLGGDGHYEGANGPRWRRIGRAVFDGRHSRLVTMHPRGLSWVGVEFRHESWFDFIGYQSGHGTADDHLAWLTGGPPSTDWATEPVLPVINLEPNYEGHPSYHGGQPITTRQVRRAAYWSLLVSPAAGVSFGHNSIWSWVESPQVPEGHPNIGVVPPWHEALETPGIESMRVLRGLFADTPCWQLRPAPNLLVTQPGERNPAHFVAAARTVNHHHAMLYLPEGGSVHLNAATLPRPSRVHWFNPRNGEWTRAEDLVSERQTFTAADDNDWVLCVGAH